MDVKAEYSSFSITSTGLNKKTLPRLHESWQRGAFLCQWNVQRAQFCHYKYRVERPKVTRKWEKLPYGLSLPKQPIYPFPGYVWRPHPVYIHATWSIDFSRSLYRVGPPNVTRIWINRLFGQAQAVWQFLPFPGYVWWPHSVRVYMCMSMNLTKEQKVPQPSNNT